MKKRLIIHIGTHKTGTTSIQNTLDKSRDVLLEKGLLYPRTDREPWPLLKKHCSVYRAARERDQAYSDSERELLLKEFEDSGCTQMLISEEGLSEPDDCFAEFFRPWSDMFTIDVVCYLRRQDYFVESLYNQFVRERARREGRPIQDFVISPQTRDRLLYNKILSKWRQEVDSVVALDFDREVKSGGLLKSFVEAAKLPVEAMHEAPANQSPDMRLIVVLNKLNKDSVKYDLAMCMKAARIIEKDRRWKKKNYILGARLRRKLLKDFEEENRCLKENFGVDFSANLPSGEGSYPVNEADADYCIALVAAMSEVRRGHAAG